MLPAVDGLEVGILIAMLAAAAAAGLTVGLQRRGAQRASGAPGLGPTGAALPGAAQRSLADVSRDPSGDGPGPASGAPLAMPPAAIPGRASAPDRDAAADLAVVGELVGPGLIRVDADHTVGAANEAAHRLLGRRPGSMVGRSLMEATADHRIEGLARTARAEGSAGGEITIRTPAAPTVVLRAGRAPDGGAWLVIEDVSELRRLQRIRREFIDNLSHELRTPLTSVSLLAEMLARDAASLPPRAAERVAKIEVETGHLVQMVNELLELSKIESGRAPLAIADVDTSRLITSTVARLALFADRQGVRLDVDPGPPGLAIRADAERLGQAFLNLLHNAIKFSPPGATVTVSVARAGHEVVIAVADRGAGIPKAALPRVFERFYKVDRARTLGVGGTGLGLSIARHVVEAHGGRIWVESEEGVGSTFRFAVPVAGPAIADAPGG